MRERSIGTSAIAISLERILKMQCDYRSALEMAKAGDWEAAHAAYWYGQGNAKLPANTLEEEWQRLSTLL